MTYKIMYYASIILSIVLVVDSIIMILAIADSGPYSGLAYGTRVLIPVYLPAFAVSIVLIGTYLYQFARYGSTIESYAEWTFIVVFLISLAIKLGIAVLRTVFDVDVWLL